MCLSIGEECLQKSAHDDALYQLEACVDVNLQNSDGKTALSLVVEKSHPEIAEMLKNAGAVE